MKKLFMNNMNSLERMEFEYERQLPMSQRERLAMKEVFRLRKEIGTSVENELAEDRPRTSEES